MTTVCSGIKSSRLKSARASTISVLRSSPKSSRIWISSALITPMSLSKSAKIICKRAISPKISWYSLDNLSCSKPVKRCSCISKMAFTWSGDRRYSLSSLISPNGAFKSSPSMMSGRIDIAPAFFSMATTLPACQIRPSRFSRASERLADFLMVSMMSSILARAMVKPSSRCPRALALLSSKMVRRVTTSWR